MKLDIDEKELILLKASVYSSIDSYKFLKWFNTNKSENEEAFEKLYSKLEKLWQ